MFVFFTNIKDQIVIKIFQIQTLNFHSDIEKLNDWDLKKTVDEDL